MFQRHTFRLWALSALLFSSQNFASSQEVDPDSPRITALVRVIQQIEPGVAALFTQVDGKIASGSGTVIHPDGFVLTNHHVLPRATGFALLSDGKPLQFRVVGRLPEKDIAVVQLIGAKTPLPVIPIGRSHDILNGESVVVAGNPGGRGTVYTAGIISSREVLGGGPNAMVMTNYKNDFRDRFIQFDAASNRGNSGGPLINMEGEVIGIVSSLAREEQNVGFAIPIDRVWERFAQVMEAELLLGTATGVTLDPFKRQATVDSVLPESAAANGGIRPKDVIVSVNKRTIRHSIDWHLALLFEAKPEKPLQLSVRRDGELHDVELSLPRDEGIASVEIDTPEPGLEYKLYHGQFSLLPDFEQLKPAQEGVVPKVDLAAIRQERDDAFAVVVAGFLKIPVAGIYRLAIVSDDGSRVLLHDQEVIDNNGNHPAKEASKRLRLQAGFHPLRIEYFEGNGDQELRLGIELLNGSGGEVGAELLFH